MQGKDYYTILDLPPTATLSEIKTAYRRLAHQYHPDKNGNDPSAATRFETVKEAYEVLSNPSKKAYYLQQRWYEQSTGKRSKQEFVTPVSVLKRALELERYVSRLDEHRMDKEGLNAYVCELLSDDTIEKLNAFNETDINKAITSSVLKSAQTLSLLHAKPLSVRLMRINTDAFTVNLIREHLRHARLEHTWDRYTPWLISLIVILLCFLIFLLSHQGYLD